VERGLAASDGLAFVWDDAGQVIGFACAHDLGFRAYLSELIVSKSARGRGVGSELVERVHHELTVRGCAILISDVWRDAEKFYRSLGWKEPDVTLMCKRLKE
jgi:GNAT superfamily N-acetyltransferase